VAEEKTRKVMPLSSRSINTTMRLKDAPVMPPATVEPSISSPIINPMQVGDEKRARRRLWSGQRHERKIKVSS